MDPDRAAYPAGPRVVAASMAALLGAYFGYALPAGLLANGYPITALATAATVAPLVVVLLWLAADPASMQRALGRWTRLDLRQGAHQGALLLMATTLFFVLGYGSLANGAFAYESVQKGEPLGEVDGNALFSGLALNVLVLTLPPILYVSFVDGGGPGRALERLGVRVDGLPRALGIGAASAIACILLLALVSAVATAAGVEVPENERALGIAKSVTVLGALGISIGAAVSEEVFFRGFLQPRIGLWGQAILFSLAHLSYVSVLEVAVTFVLALVFGLVYRATGNLWAPIAGHFLFNMIMLLVGIYAPEAAT